MRYVKLDEPRLLHYIGFYSFRPVETTLDKINKIRGDEMDLAAIFCTTKLDHISMIYDTVLCYAVVCYAVLCYLIPILP